MRAEISSFPNLNERLEHHTSDTELRFTNPPTEAGRRRYEFKREKITQRLEETRSEVLKFEFLERLYEEVPKARVYLVGGAVRDAIIGKKSKDYDFIIGGINADRLREFLTQHGRVKDVESREFGVFKFHPTKIPEGITLTEPIEIALPRSEKYHGGGTRRDVKTISDPNLPIEKDLKRRDFTVNSMALNLETGELVDSHDGVGDLEKGILRAVGDPEQRFNFEDPSRILRGFRFACTLGLDIEQETYQAIQKYSTEIWANLEASRQATQKLKELGVEKPTYTTTGYNEICQQMLEKVETEKDKDRLRVAAETVAKEFLKGFHADPVRMIRLLRDTDALFMMMPELIDTIGIEQPRKIMKDGTEISAHQYDVWGHILKALEALSDDASINLQLATLFHDIGKPRVLKLPEETGDRIRFHGHDVASAEITRNLCNRLRLASSAKNGSYYVDTNRVCWLVENHMKLRHFDEMEETTREKYLVGERGLELLELHHADHLAGSGDLSIYEKALDWRERVLQPKEAAQAKFETIPPLVNGYDIMQTLQIDSGPKVGELLTAVREAQLAGQITTKKEALVWINKVTSPLR